MEPPDLWTKRIPARFVDSGPRVLRHRFASAAMRGGALRPVYDDEGPIEGEVWYFEHRRFPIPLTQASAGLPLDSRTFLPTTFEAMRPGFYDAAERLKDMDLDGLAPSLRFPNILPRFCGQTFSEAKDKELGLAGIHAYKDWMIEEWVGRSDGRIVGNGIVPLWDPILAGTEVRGPR